MKLAKIELENISEKLDPFAIKNFIISDKTITVPKISSEYPVILDGVAFIICVQGEGKARINFKEYTIRKNTIITILPFFITEITEKNEDLMMEFLIFSNDFLSDIQNSPNLEMLANIVRQPCIEVNEEEVKSLLEFHSFIVKQYKRKDHPYREEMAKSLLHGLMAEVGGIYYEKFIRAGENEALSPTSRHEEIATKFFKLVVDNHKTEKSLQFYADKMFITPKYLSTVLKERTGRTAMDWINEAVIASTKYLLKTTDMTVAQISEEMNFPNPSFFGRFFKKHTGMTPLKYKED